jgi:O-antigen/teichoic acid export membrane protein
LPGLIGLFIIKTIYPEFAGQGKVKMFIPIFFYIGVIQVILNIILISQFSIYGSAVSSSITYLILAIILVQKFLKFRKLKLKELIIPSIKEINLLFKNT